jgi:hypothetical protein
LLFHLQLPTRSQIDQNFKTRTANQTLKENSIAKKYPRLFFFQTKDGHSKLKL